MSAKKYLSLDGLTEYDALIKQEVYEGDESVISYVDTEVAKKANSSHNHDAANITSGTIAATRLPQANGTQAGITIVYPAAQCTTFSSDTGTVTPLAVQKGAKQFAIARPASTTNNAVARYSNTTGDVQNSKILIEDVTNTRDTSKTANILAIPAEGNKKMVYGYCTDQVDGTSFLGGLFDINATEFPYSAGLAIGGSSGNLLWKGDRVLTATDLNNISSTYETKTNASSKLTEAKAYTDTEITGLQEAVEESYVKKTDSISTEKIEYEHAHLGTQTLTEVIEDVYANLDGLTAHNETLSEYYYTKTEVDNTFAIKEDVTQLQNDVALNADDIADLQSSKANVVYVDSEVSGLQEYVSANYVDKAYLEEIDGSHYHENKDVLDGITAEQVSNWDGGYAAGTDYLYWKMHDKDTEYAQIETNANTYTDQAVSVVQNEIANVQTEVDKYERFHLSLLPASNTIPENADLNTIEYLKVQSYFCSQNAVAATLTNCPVTTAFMMEVYSPLSTAVDNETTSTWCYRIRRIKEYQGDEYYQFCNTSGTAGEWTYGIWKKIKTDDDIKYSTTDLTAGSSSLKTGALYVVYE